jgi:hypothetical protein
MASKPFKAWRRTMLDYSFATSIPMAMIVVTTVIFLYLAATSLFKH